MKCRDHVKRVFPKFEAEQSYPRGVNRRSKFCKQSICCDVFANSSFRGGDGNSVGFSDMILKQDVTALNSFEKLCGKHQMFGFCFR